MKALIRTKVSADRTRFEDGQYNLDLAYITDRIIAMGIPGEGLQSVWRNNIEKVSSMLKKYHNDHYKVWNLSQLKYDYEKFDNQIVELGFPDHHNPPLELLFEIIYSIDNWLKEHPENVAVVHCLGGKGRTGTVIASYLIYSGVYSDPIEALDHFAERRSSIKKGVTQASQRRYVEYFSKILQQRMAPYPRKILLQRLVLHNIPCFSKSKKGFKPFIKVTSLASNIKDSTGNNWSFSSPNVLFQSSPQNKKPTFCDYSQGSYEIELDTVVEGDIMVTCSHMSKKEVKVFRCSLHTAFLSDSVLELSRHELDDIKKSDTRFDENFGITMYFAEVHDEDQEDQEDGEEKTKDSSRSSQLTQTQALRLTVTYSQIFDRLKAEETVNDQNSTKAYSQIDAKTNTLLLRPLRGAEQSQKAGKPSSKLSWETKSHKLNRDQNSVSYKLFPVGPPGSIKSGGRSDTFSLPLSSISLRNVSPPKGSNSARGPSSLHSSFPNLAPPPSPTSFPTLKGPRGMFSSSKSSSSGSLPIPVIYQASISIPTQAPASSTIVNNLPNHSSLTSMEGESSTSVSSSLSSSTSSTATSPTSVSPGSVSPASSPRHSTSSSSLILSSSLPSEAHTSPIVIPSGRGPLSNSTPGTLIPLLVPQSSMFSPAIVPKTPRSSSSSTTPLMNTQRVGKERVYHAHSSPGHLQVDEGRMSTSSPPNIPATPELGRITPLREKSRSLNSRPRTHAITNDLFPLGKSAASFPPPPHPNTAAPCERN